MNPSSKWLHSVLCLTVLCATLAMASPSETLLQNAQQLIHENRYGEALAVLGEILESDAETPAKAEAAAEAGDILVRLGRFDEAVARLETANTLLEASDIPETFRYTMAGIYTYRLANAYALAGKWEQARTVFETLMEQASRSFGKPESISADRMLRSAQTKRDWIQTRIFAHSTPTLRFTASLLAFALMLSLCLYIFARDPLSYLNFSLSLFLFGFALWQLADAIRSSTLSPETALFWGKVLLAGMVWVCLANLNFILLFLRRRKAEDFETLRWFFVILPLAALLALVPTDLYTQGADLFYWRWEASIHNQIPRLFFLYIALYVLYGITMIARANVTISRGHAAKPITYLFFTLSFILAPSLVAVLLVPLSRVGGYVIGVSSLVVIGMAIGLIYSIHRYRLIDVDSVVSQSLGYFVFTGLILGAYVLLVNLLSQLLSRLFHIHTSFWAYIGATLIVSVLFQPMRNRVQVFLDRLFHKERNLYQRTLLDFSQAITKILDLEQLYHLLVVTVIDAMRIEAGWLLIEQDNGNGSQIVASAGLDRLQQSTIRNLPSAIEPSDTDATLSIPLQQDEHIIGSLKLGRKLSGKAFTRSDREVLKILANQAAVAIANARLVSQLRRADQLTMLGRLSAGIAHEVRNPLLAIRGAAQFLQGKAGEASEEGEFAAIIVEESDRINQLVTQFLDYARPAKPQLGPLDIVECLDRTLTLLSVELRHARAELQREYASGLPNVLGDERQLGQLFLNLILNAVEAMPRGGILRVGVRHQGDFCFVEISDTGIGMTKEERARIFEPFYTGKEHGLGLGLAIVQEIVSQHEGTIAMESEKEKGTTFSVGLRVAQ